MKRLFLTVMAVISLSMTTFAEGEKFNGVDNVSAYDMSVNYGSLGRALGLTFEQLDAVEEVNRTFKAEMLSASTANKEARKSMMDAAIKKDLRKMRYILDKEQYRTYLALLNATINNRGLND